MGEVGHEPLPRTPAESQRSHKRPGCRSRSSRASRRWRPPVRTPHVDPSRRHRAAVRWSSPSTAASGSDSQGFFYVYSLGCCGGEEEAYLFKRGGWEYAVSNGYSRNTPWEVINVTSPDGEHFIISEAGGNGAPFQGPHQVPTAGGSARPWPRATAAARCRRSAASASSERDSASWGQFSTDPPGREASIVYSWTALRIASHSKSLSTVCPDNAVFVSPSGVSNSRGTVVERITEQPEPSSCSPIKIRCSMFATLFPHRTNFGSKDPAADSAPSTITTAAPMVPAAWISASFEVAILSSFPPLDRTPCSLPGAPHHGYPSGRPTPRPWSNKRPPGRRSSSSACKWGS